MESFNGIDDIMRVHQQLHVGRIPALPFFNQMGKLEDLLISGFEVFGFVVAEMVDLAY